MVWTKELNEDERDIHGLIAALGEKKPLVQKETLESLVKLGESAVEALIQALKDKRWSVRERAAVALGRIRDTRAVDPLVQVLKDEDRRVEWAVIMPCARQEVHGQFRHSSRLSGKNDAPYQEK